MCFGQDEWSAIYKIMVKQYWLFNIEGHMTIQLRNTDSNINVIMQETIDATHSTR